MSFPQRRKRTRSGIRDNDGPIRCPSHLAWIPGHECSAKAMPGHVCEGRVQAAHVRIGTDGGSGMKPGDNFTLPLCALSHATQHSIGERSFERIYGVAMKEIAEKLWQTSPHRIKFERKQQESK